MRSFASTAMATSASALEPLLEAIADTVVKMATAVALVAMSPTFTPGEGVEGDGIGAGDGIGEGDGTATANAVSEADTTRETAESD